MRKLIAAVVLSMVFAAPAFATQHAAKHPKAAHATNPYIKHPAKHHVDHAMKHKHRFWPFHKK